MQDGPKTAAPAGRARRRLRDQGDNEKATQTYARALAAVKGKNAEASACLEDVQVTEASVAGARRATARDRRTKRARRPPRRGSSCARRASRGASRPRRWRGCSRRPTPPIRPIARRRRSTKICSSRRSARRPSSSSSGRCLASIGDTAARGDAALRFGTRWVTRHQNLEAGVELLQEAFAADPSNEAAFTFLREIWGTKEGNWERVVELLDRATQARPTNGSETFILAQAAHAHLAPARQHDARARYFERLSAISPDHPSLKAFEEQIGEAINRARLLEPSRPPRRSPLRRRPRPSEPRSARSAASDPGASTPQARRRRGRAGDARARGGQGRGCPRRTKGKSPSCARSPRSKRAPSATTSTSRR